MSGGGEGSSGAKRAAQSQALIARDLFSSTAIGRQLGLSQNLNMLRTGGRGGVLPPVLASALRGADQGTAATLTETTDAINKTGGGQFKQGILNTITQAGGQTREDVRGQFTRDAIAKSPDLAIQPVQLATQGLQGLVRRGAQEQVAKQQKENAIITGSASAAGAVVAAAVIAYAI
jgi:hypothetical protein